MEDFNAEFDKSLGTPDLMEALYRRNRAQFSSRLKSLAETDDNAVLRALWKARIDYRSEFDWGLLVKLIVLGILCWVPTRVLMEVQPTAAFSPLRDFFPFLFFAFWGVAIALLDRRLVLGLPIVGVAAVLALVLQLYPHDPNSQSRNLALLHSYSLLWSTIPLVLGRFRFPKRELSRQFVERTGESLCWASLLVVGGVFLSVVSVGLLNALGFQITEFYIKNVVTLGLILTAFLGLYFAGDINDFKISGILARIFAPLTTLAVLVFLIAAVLGYSKLFAEKEAFTFFSIVPMVVIALIFFLNVTRSTSRVFQYSNLLLTCLSILFVSLLVPATVFRISTWGITPNKVAVLGIDLLLLITLVAILVSQVSTLRRKRTNDQTTDLMMKFLPLFWGWSLIVVLFFPVVFQFQ